MNRSALGLMAGLAFLALDPQDAFGAATGQIAADVTPGPSEETVQDPVRLYQPDANFSASKSFAEAGTAGTSPLQALDRVLSRLATPLDIRQMPIKRALILYKVDPDGCILVPLMPDEGNPADEISSDIIVQTHFWLFVMAERGFKSRGDLRSFATIDGAELFTKHVTLAHLDRQMAPNFRALISMLVSGRVDAIPMSEIALEQPDLLPDGIIRLEPEPYLVLNNGLRCKRSARTEALITELNAIIAEQHTLPGKPPSMP